MASYIPEYNYYLEIPSQNIELAEDWLIENYPDEMFAVIDRNYGNELTTSMTRKWKWRMGFETKEAMIACKLMFG